MDKILVHGGYPLSGSIKVSGSKNSSLPILAATLLTREPCIVHRRARPERHALHAADFNPSGRAGGTGQRNRQRHGGKDPFRRAVRRRAQDARFCLCAWAVAGPLQRSDCRFARWLRHRRPAY